MHFDGGSYNKYLIIIHKYSKEPWIIFEIFNSKIFIGSRKHEKIKRCLIKFIQIYHHRHNKSLCCFGRFVIISILEIGIRSEYELRKSKLPKKFEKRENLAKFLSVDSSGEEPVEQHKVVRNSLSASAPWHLSSYL